jgi:hypothetical protein
MGLWAAIKGFLGPGSSGPPDWPRLHCNTESALGQSLDMLPVGQRGWITFAEARALFSTMDAQYAFGQMDDEGRRKLESFAANHLSLVQIMPTEHRVYFVRQAK